MKGPFREILQWPFLAILGSSTLLALVIPPEWIRVIPGVDVLLRAVIDWVPATRDYIRVSRFPDVASVYFPLMLLLSPLHFLWVWKMVPRTAREERFARNPVKASFSLIGTLAILGLVAFFTFGIGGGQLKIIPWNESRIALALAGYAASGGAFFGLLAELVLFCEGAIKRLRRRR